MLVTVMGRLMWAGSAIVAWFATPVLSRFLTGADRSHQHELSRAEAFRLAGRLLIVLPVLSVLGTWPPGGAKLLVGPLVTEVEPLERGNH